MLPYFKFQDVKSFDFDFSEGMQFQQAAKTLYNDPDKWQILAKHNVAAILTFKGNLSGLSKIKIPQNPGVYK